MRLPAFRGLWMGSAVYFTGGAMLVMAASWLMVEQTGSPFLAALVQTAVFLPNFLLALPAGVLADGYDRRTLILRALTGQATIILALAVLAAIGWASPPVLLGLMFASGCCGALLSPAWSTGVADTVPRDDMPQAITAMAIAWNSSRAIGPSIAGALFAWVGAGGVFAVGVFSVITMIYAVRRWPPAAHAKRVLPAERLWSGSLAGLRFARHSPMILAQLLRTVAFSAAGSALWALLPTIAAQQLNLGAGGYGALVGCLGLGAVSVGLVLGKLRARLGLDRLVSVGCVAFALVMLIVAFSTHIRVVFVSLAVAGAAWMAAMATFNTATQSSAPPWVRSRAVALHTVCALGSFALGSALWGALSSVIGLPLALTIAAAAVLAGILLSRRFPLRMGEHQEVTPVALWDEMLVNDPPEPGDGPVSVELGYRIREGADEEFLEAVSRLGASRRRDGAALWRIYRDLSEPSRYVERFIVASWAEYLHQRSRSTLADQELDALVRGFVRPGEPVRLQHYIAERKAQ